MARAAKLQAGMNSTGPPLRASMRSRVLTTTSSAVASPSRRPTRSSDPGSPDMGERRWDVKATFVVTTQPDFRQPNWIQPKVG